MDIKELAAIIARGEDSAHQFKRDAANADSLAAEMIAFSNLHGGLLLIGVDDDGSISGLDAQDIARINRLVSNAASQNVHPRSRLSRRTLRPPKES